MTLRILFCFFLRSTYLLILFLVVVDLRCSVQVSHCSGSSCCGAQAPGALTSAVVAHNSRVLALEYWLSFRARA